MYLVYGYFMQFKIDTIHSLIEFIGSLHLFVYGRVGEVNIYI